MAPEIVRKAVAPAAGFGKAVARPRNAFVTFLAGDGDYVKGAVGLAKGLRKARSAYPLVVAVLPDVPESHRSLLQSQGCIVREIVPVYPPENQTQFAMAYYVINYSKLRIWERLDDLNELYTNTNTNTNTKTKEDEDDHSQHYHQAPKSIPGCVFSNVSNLLVTPGSPGKSSKSTPSYSGSGHAFGSTEPKLLPSGREVASSVSPLPPSISAVATQSSDGDRDSWKNDLHRLARWIEKIRPFKLLRLVVLIRQHLQGFFVTIWIGTRILKSNDNLSKQTTLKLMMMITVLLLMSSVRATYEEPVVPISQLLRYKALGYENADEYIRDLIEVHPYKEIGNENAADMLSREKKGKKILADCMKLTSQNKTRTEHTKKDSQIIIVISDCFVLTVAIIGTVWMSLEYFKKTYTIIPRSKWIVCNVGIMSFFLLTGILPLFEIRTKIIVISAAMGNFLLTISTQYQTIGKQLTMIDIQTLGKQITEELLNSNKAVENQITAQMQALLTSNKAVENQIAAHMQALKTTIKVVIDLLNEQKTLYTNQFDELEEEHWWGR